MDFKMWFMAEDGHKQKVDKLLNGQNFVFFFTRGDDVFGAPEESRLVFARMKSPDNQMPDAWQDDATFSALNLIKALSGEENQNIFGKKDLGSIQIMDKDKIAKKLSKIKAKKGKIGVKPHSQNGLGIIKLKDRK